MKQTSLKSDRVADLLDDLVTATGETKVDAVTKALEDRLRRQRSDGELDRVVTWLQHTVWSRLPEGVRGAAPSKEEQEAILGF
jgi:hypothetical protein